MVDVFLVVQQWWDARHVLIGILVINVAKSINFNSGMVSAHLFGDVHIYLEHIVLVVFVTGAQLTLHHAKVLRSLLRVIQDITSREILAVVLVRLASITVLSVKVLKFVTNVKLVSF